MGFHKIFTIHLKQITVIGKITVMQIQISQESKQTINIGLNVLLSRNKFSKHQQTRKLHRDQLEWNVNARVKMIIKIIYQTNWQCNAHPKGLMPPSDNP